MNTHVKPSEEAEIIGDISYHEELSAEQIAYYVNTHLHDIPEENIGKFLRNASRVHRSLLERLARLELWSNYVGFAMSLASNLGPGVPHAWSAWSYGLFRLGDWKESLEIAKMARDQICYGDPGLYVEVSRNYVQRKKYTKALECLDKGSPYGEPLIDAVRQDPDFQALFDWEVRMAKRTRKNRKPARR